MHEQHIPDDDAVTARHRAPVSVLRRTAHALAAVAGCVLATAALGWVAATALGLTGPSAAVPGAVPDALPSSPAQQFEMPPPAFARTLDLEAKRAARAERSSPAVSTPAPAGTSEAPRSSSRAPEPAPEPPPEPSREPERDAVVVVRTGDPCTSEGDRAVTKSGSAAVCSAKGNGRPRWRRA